MGGVLRHDVHVTLDDNTTKVLAAGTTVPAEFEKYVTNPKAYVGDDEAAGDGGQESDTDDGPYAGVPYGNLQAELKRRELPQNGKQDELIARLVADDADRESELDDEAAGDGGQESDDLSEE